MYFNRKLSGMMMVSLMILTLLGSQAVITQAIPADGPVNHPTLKVGDYLQFGTFYQQPIVWRLIHIDEQGQPILLSDRILTLRAFDAGGDFHAGDTERVQYGSNYYPDSNLRQWLNSSSLNEGNDVIDWVQNDPLAERMYQGKNGYNQDKGFLADSNFTATERSLLKAVPRDVIVSQVDVGKKDGGSQLFTNATTMTDIIQNYDTAYSKRVSDHVFLLSVKELKNYIYDQQATLGSSYHMAKPTAEAISQSQIINESWMFASSDMYWKYWLSTPLADDSKGVRVMDNLSEETVSSKLAFEGWVGVRPAIKFDAAIALFNDGGDGSSGNPYVVNRNALNVDTEAPSIPTGLTANNVTDSGFTMTWTDSTDNVGVAGYEIYRDGKYVETVQETVYSFTKLAEYSKSLITIKAKDAAGNLSAPSHELGVMTVDRTAPTIPNISVTNVTSSSFRLNWDESSDSGAGLFGYQIYLNGKLKAFVLDRKYMFLDLNDKETYTVSVKAMDKSDNVSGTSQVLTVSLADKIAPTAPTQVSVSATSATSVTLTWAASTDNVAVTAYEVYRGTVLLKKLPGSTQSLIVSGLSAGTSYSFTIKAYDAAGNGSPLSTNLKIQTQSTLNVIGKTISLNGKLLNLGAGVEPAVINGTTMVPFRVIFEALGLNVSFNATTKIIEGIRKDYNLKLTLHSKTAVVNGKINKVMPQSPAIIKGVTMVPLRFVGEELGLVVTYKSK